jgi:hypothetical protein
MANMLKTGLAHLTSMLATHASETVVYSRGGDSVSVSATVGQKLLRLTDMEGGSRLEYTDLDFIIPTAQLVLSGSPILPERGDLIERTIDDEVSRYEVSPYGSDPAWRYSDPYQSVVRIHTKSVDEGYV